MNIDRAVYTTWLKSRLILLKSLNKPLNDINPVSWWPVLSSVKVLLPNLGNASLTIWVITTPLLQAKINAKRETASHPKIMTDSFSFVHVYLHTLLWPSSWVRKNHMEHTCLLTFFPYCYILLSLPQTVNITDRLKQHLFISCYAQKTNKKRKKCVRANYKKILLMFFFAPSHVYGRVRSGIFTRVIIKWELDMR